MTQQKTSFQKVKPIKIISSIKLLKNQDLKVEKRKVDYTRIEKFLKKEKPQLKEHWELFKEQASEKEVKLLEKAAKEKRSKNKKMVKKIMEIEKMLETLDTKNYVKKVVSKQSKKTNPDLKKMTSLIQKNTKMNMNNLNDKLFGVDGETMERHKNLQNEERRKLQKKAIENLIKEEMENTTLEKRLDDIFHSFEQQIGDNTSSTAPNLEKEMLKLLKMQKGNNFQQPTEQLTSCVKQGKIINTEKAKQSGSHITPSTKNSSKPQIYKNFLKRTTVSVNTPRRNMLMNRSFDSTNDTSKPSKSMKSKGRNKKSNHRPKSEIPPMNQRRKKNFDLYAIREKVHESDFRNKVKEELKNIRSGKINYKNFTGEKISDAEKMARTNSFFFPKDAKKIKKSRQNVGGNRSKFETSGGIHINKPKKKNKLNKSLEGKRFSSSMDDDSFQKNVARQLHQKMTPKSKHKYSKVNFPSQYNSNQGKSVPIHGKNLKNPVNFPKKMKKKKKKKVKGNGFALL